MNRPLRAIRRVEAVNGIYGWLRNEIVLRRLAHELKGPSKLELVDREAGFFSLYFQALAALQICQWNRQRLRSASPARCAEQIASAMNLKIDGSEIAQKVLALGKPETKGDEYSKETLFYPGHETGTEENEWRTHLPSSLQREINREFRWWFEECGYPID